VTADEAADVLTLAAKDRRCVEDVLREIRPDIIPPRALAYPYVDLVEVEIDPAAVAIVPEALARNHNALPLSFDGDRLVVALTDPTNVIALDDLRTASGHELRLTLAEPAAIDDAWIRLGAIDRTTQTMLESAAPDEDDTHDAFDPANDAPIVRAINQIIAKAVQQRASDIHIEPQEHDVRVRFRLDGVLHDIMHIPRSLRAGLVSRLKIMAELNIADTRIPQDGRISVVADGSPIDLRVATIPSVWGETIVLRLLDRSFSDLTLEHLGFPEDTLARYQKAFQRPYGAILVVGPTGSGKSTTLYSTLCVVNDVSRKIITVEDPVELRLPGLIQIHVNQKVGLSFATALRSILRSDPDVVMVGEIRDPETARIAIEAAMTGHLVFSTLHTNDAPSALSRLVEMGVEPFLVASALECVLAQRLARKLCPRCREPYAPAPDVLREYGMDQTDTLYRAVGCNQCAGTGYSGRIALIELMPVTEDIERLTVERRSADELRKAARSEGMRSLLEDGLAKAQAGITSLEEVLRILEGRGVSADQRHGNGSGVAPIRLAAS
jgi:type IV pilus assembly protein PilB